MSCESTEILADSTNPIWWVSTFQREKVKVHMQIMKNMIWGGQSPPNSRVECRNWVAKVETSAVRDEAALCKYQLSSMQNEYFHSTQIQHDPLQQYPRISSIKIKGDFDPKIRIQPQPIEGECLWERRFCLSFVLGFASIFTDSTHSMSTRDHTSNGRLFERI